MNIYYDESNYTPKISISKKNSNMTTYFPEQNNSWFYYVFYSAKNEEFLRKGIINLKKKYKNNSTGRLKSSSFVERKKDFLSMSESNKNFYIEFLKLIIDQKQLFQIGAVNKIGELIYDWIIFSFNYVKNNGILFWNICLHRLAVSITWLVNEYCQKEFLQFIEKEHSLLLELNFVGQEVLKLISLLRRKMVFETITNFENYVLEIHKVINYWSCIRTTIKYIRQHVASNVEYPFPSEWKFNYLNDSLGMLLVEQGIAKFTTTVIVDNHDLTLQQISKSFIARSAISSKEPMLRVCDFLVGLVRKIGNWVSTLRNGYKVVRKNNDLLNLGKPFENKEILIDEKSKIILFLLQRLCQPYFYWTVTTNHYGVEINAIFKLIQLIRDSFMKRNILQPRILQLNKEVAIFFENSIAKKCQEDVERIRKLMIDYFGQDFDIESVQILYARTAKFLEAELNL